MADRDSLCEIFALGPAKVLWERLYSRNILEVEGGSRLLWKDGRLRKEQYWQLQSRPHEDSFEETVEKTSWLVEDAVKLQMLSDMPICTFLSGGGGQFPGHSYLCQGAEETGEGTPYFLL